MTRTTRISIAFAAVTSIFTVPALAAEPGFYLSASLGRAEESPKSSGTNISIGFFPSQIQRIYPTRVDADDSGAAWGAGVGYRFNRHVAAEIEYIDFGRADVSENYDLSAILPALPGVPIGTPVIITPAVLTRTYSSRVKGPALSVLGTLPVGKAWDLFLRVGVLFADREIEIGQSIGLGDNTFGSTVWLAGVGADWSFANRWAARAEYQHTGKLDNNFLTGETELERMSLSVLFKF
jgi:opacity protein-like surface antigen